MAEGNNGFEPKIVGFLCNWCTASAADLAGTTRAQYPPNLHPVRVMCSGTVDPVYLIKALLSGADSVMVGGCHPGDCHYVSGNYKARRRMVILKEILKDLGLDPDRLKVEWIAASEGPRFAEVVKEFDERLKAMGPNPMKEEWSQ